MRRVILWWAQTHSNVPWSACEGCLKSIPSLIHKSLDRFHKGQSLIYLFFFFFFFSRTKSRLLSFNLWYCELPQRSAHNAQSENWSDEHLCSRLTWWLEEGRGDWNWMLSVLPPSHTKVKQVKTCPVLFVCLFPKKSIMKRTLNKHPLTCCLTDSLIDPVKKQRKRQKSKPLHCFPLTFPMSKWTNITNKPYAL